MLDTETKRRIDTCRDILVGKVPDPKSQVEQITVALIYKFMDDMDLQSEELGGERKFFTKEYERYRWAKLVAPGVGGQDMLNIYSEALTKMVENDGLPQLFRNIFRNAYLPYRDPETLRAFLREINSFSYDHSEKLGDAFEYLLSVLGSQGDAGQFRTPRHIIDFVVEIINPQKHEVIMDPACGTAGFLISAYKHVLKQNSTHVFNGNGNGAEADATEQALESPLRYPGDLLKPEDRKRLARNIRGYDISPDMVRLSLVNLYLHGFADPQIEEYDTLTSEDKWTEMADVILANPPFMSPKGGIKPHTKFQVQSKRSEVLFVDYIAEHLTPNGRAAIIVPEGIIFQSQTAYVALRKMLVENHLAAVISLPAGVFNPYSGVKTSILILDRAVAKASKHVAFFKIENDGFQLGAQRKAQKGSQLPQVIAELADWLKEARQCHGDRLRSSIGIAVDKTQIALSDDYNLEAERYCIRTPRISAFEYRSLKDFCDISAGNPAPQDEKYFEGGTLPFIRTSDVGQVHRSIHFCSSVDKVTKEAAQILRLREFPSGTILFPKSGASTFLNHRVMLSGPAYVSSHLACITPNPQIALPEYIYHLLCKVDGRDLVPDQSYPSLRLERLGDIEVPLPPLDVQREIVAEIEGYQRVIDGARTVVESYRPHIPVDPEWVTYEVQSVVDPITPPLKLQTSEYSNFGEFPIIDQSQDFIAGWTSNSEAAIDPEKGFVIFGDHTCVVKFIDQPFVQGADGIKILRPKEGILAKYLAFYLQAYPLQQDGYRRHFSKLKEHKVRVPDLDKQEVIVAGIEAEQAIVNGNRDLIARFEKKIEAVIARVWGEGKSEEGS